MKKVIFVENSVFSLVFVLVMTLFFSGCGEKDIKNVSSLKEKVKIENVISSDVSYTDSEEENSSKSTSTSATKPETSKEQSEKPTPSKIKPHDSSTAQSGFANVTSKTQSVMSETKSQNSSTTQTTSIKVTSTAPTYTDFFVCEYTIYLKREYADKQYTVSDFTNLPVKKLEENKLIYHLFADYTKKEEVLASFKSIMSRKEVDNVFCEYSSYRVLEGETEPKLPSLERQVFGKEQERNLYYDGAISTTVSSEDFTVWSVADFPELSLEAIEGSIYSKDCNSSWLVMYLATLGDEARINAAEKLKARKDVVSVSEKYSPFDYED